MQGYLDVTGASWDAETKILSGKSKLVGNDPYVITIAAEGLIPESSSCESGNTTSGLSASSDGLVRLTLTSTKNLDENWTVIFKK